MNKELSKKLRRVYIKADRGEQALSVFLFGIRHRIAIKKIGPKQLIKDAKIPKGYLPEIYKGMRLGKYVTFK